MTAAQLCRTLNRSRGSEIDLGIAACTMQQRTGLWTRNDAELIDAPRFFREALPRGWADPRFAATIRAVIGPVTSPASAS